MNSCKYCSWRNGQHDAICPRKETDEWRAGYSDGYAGKDEQFKDAVYLLGYGCGIVAQEEWFNGFDPVIDGRQW